MGIDGKQLACSTTLARISVCTMCSSLDHDCLGRNRSESLRRTTMWPRFSSKASRRNEAQVIYVVFWGALSSYFILVSAVSNSCRSTCGGISIQYPFGIDEGCGSSEFSNALQCSSTNILTFATPSGFYPVQSIDYSNKTIALTDPTMTTCGGGLATGKNFSLHATGKFHLSGNGNLLLLNCKTNASLVHSSLFSCNESASVCSAFKTCTDYGNTNTSKLVTTCCALTQKSNSSFDLSLLR